MSHTRYFIFCDNDPIDQELDNYPIFVAETEEEAESSIVHKNLFITSFWWMQQIPIELIKDFHIYDKHITTTRETHDDT
jgi:hypothetical protein